MKEFIPWADIEQFHNIRKYIKAYPDLYPNSQVTYKAKVKLHGTNAAIQCYSDGTVIAQSRTQIISENNDNAGFAKFVKQNESAFNLKNDMILFGEWAGKSIQSSVAVSQLDKSFYIFAAKSLVDDTFIIEPDQLKAMIGNISNTFVIPWYYIDHGITTMEVKRLGFYTDFIVDWLKSDEDLKAVTGLINRQVIKVEDEDPFIKTLGVSGTGEGLVFYPTSSSHLGYENFKNLTFKAKGEVHRVKKAKEAVQVNPDLVSSIEKFVDIFVTEQRLNQGLSTVCPNGFDKKFIGKFIAWVVSDVEKESKDELEVSGLIFGQVSKAVTDRAKKWILLK